MRNLGVGTQLVTAAVRYMKDTFNIPNPVLEIDKRLTKARKAQLITFYERNGFTQDEPKLSLMQKKYDHKMTYQAPVNIVVVDDSSAEEEPARVNINPNKRRTRSRALQETHTTT